MESKSKICIVVFGNIAAGKSTVIRRFINKNPNFYHACIDNFRIKNYALIPDTEAREKQSVLDFKSEFFKHDCIIYESCGASKLFEAMKYEILLNYKTAFIFVKCGINECIHRFANRKNNELTMPGFASKYTTYQVMVWLEHKMLKEYDLLLNSERMKPSEMAEKLLSFLQNEG